MFKLFSRKKPKTWLRYLVYRRAPGAAMWELAGPETASLLQARALAGLSAREGYEARIIAVRYTKTGPVVKKSFAGEVARTEPRPAAPPILPT